MPYYNRSMGFAKDSLLFHYFPCDIEVQCQHYAGIYHNGFTACICGYRELDHEVIADCECWCDRSSEKPHIVPAVRRSRIPDIPRYIKPEQATESMTVLQTEDEIMPCSGHPVTWEIVIQHELIANRKRYVLITGSE